MIIALDVFFFDIHTNVLASPPLIKESRYTGPSCANCKEVHSMWWKLVFSSIASVRSNCRFSIMSKRGIG